MNLGHAPRISPTSTQLLDALAAPFAPPALSVQTDGTVIVHHLADTLPTRHSAASCATRAESPGSLTCPVTIRGNHAPSCGCPGRPEGTITA